MQARESVLSIRQHNGYVSYNYIYFAVISNTEQNKMSRRHLWLFLCITKIKEVKICIRVIYSFFFCFMVAEILGKLNSGLIVRLYASSKLLHNAPSLDGFISHNTCGLAWQRWQL